MSDRGGRLGGAGAPFYAPPRRKTSAEIISEARAAIYGDMGGSASGSGGALRALRTRRPFTPREPQRTLFAERARKPKDNRPPSAFDLKHLTLGETEEESLTSSISPSVIRISTLDEGSTQRSMLMEPHPTPKKKPALRTSKSVTEKPNEWSGFPKLPHLSGRSKPLHHRRGTSSQGDESILDLKLGQSISVSKALGNHGDVRSKSHCSKQQESSNKKKLQINGSKSLSCDSGSNSTTGFGDVSIRHLDVQLPTGYNEDYDNMSLLEFSESLLQRSIEPEKTLALLDLMISSLEKSNPSGNLRDLVLRSLYRHIDSEDEKILVSIARGMLTMRVTGTHLAAACKLVFKIARNDKNDHFFRNTNLLELLVEGCGRADPLTEGECCVYGAGALRFLALEPRLCALAHKAGALHLAALHLKILNNAKSESPRSVSEQSTHALYQLTGALRNLAGSSGEVPSFVSSGALRELVAALLAHTDRDVLTNVARCLSVLSAEESCCSWLCSSSQSAHALVRALSACAARAPLAVRLAYTLGNMAAVDDQARLNIYNEEGGVDVLLTILETYTKRNSIDSKETDEDPDLHLVGSDLGGSDGSNEDVLIKTVRVVANLCLSEAAGRGLAESHSSRAVSALLCCLQLAEKDYNKTQPQVKAEEYKNWLERKEELATAALVTLNNITFFREPPEPPDPLDEVMDALCQVACSWLPRGGSASCEAVRALGNMTRAPRAAQTLVLHGALEHLPVFLQHEDESVRCAAAGVLVNVCGAGVSCGVAGALAALALGAAPAGDSATAALLARALWNAHAHYPLTPENALKATQALNAFIDDESVFAACEAVRSGSRRASHPDISHHVHFEEDNNNTSRKGSLKVFIRRPVKKSCSIDNDMHLREHFSDSSCSDSEDERTVFSGEDQGFEEGEMGALDECSCPSCRKLAAWEELVAVALPLLDKLKPQRTDASVGTD